MSNGGIVTEPGKKTEPKFSAECNSFGFADGSTPPVIYGVGGEAKNGSVGVVGQNSDNTNDGVLGSGKTGVHGKSMFGDGVFGESQSAQHAGVSAVNDKGGFGVWARGNPGGHFESSTGPGVHGISVADDGVRGESQSAQHAGVSAVNNSGGFGLWATGHPAGHFEGDVAVTGNLSLKGDLLLVNADCAEEFELAAPDESEPGTVMVLDQSGALQPSQVAYDKRVAGVISGAGDLRPGIVLGTQPSGGKRMPIALLGKVYCKVDAHYAPIGVGDLLTTSPTPGYAMKANDPFKAFGSVIGKALRPLTTGQGLIPILIALQ